MSRARERRKRAERLRWFQMQRARHITRALTPPPDAPVPTFKALSPSFEAPLLSAEPRPRVASVHSAPLRLAPRRSGTHRALLLMAMLGLGGLPRDPGDT